MLRSDEYTDYASQAADKLRQHYQKLEVTAQMQEMEKSWIGEEYRFADLIDDLSVAFGDVVFPLNKFTRRRAALRGSSLYLPGLIKAMTTEWSYKKIFSAKLAGGKREHAACLVLDASTSMFGTLSSGLTDGILVLIGALRKLNLDNCGVIVFGKDVRLIKTNEQSWDAACISTVMNELRFDQDDDTRDADALEVAVDLLGHCSVRGEKKIFILTDGYTNCGNHLTMVQQRAEDNGIDLVAIAIGTDQTNLKSMYKRYVQCTTSYGLPKAIRSLFEHETPLFSLDRSSKKDTGSASNSVSTESLFKDIESKKVYSDMIKDLTGEREMKLMNSGQSSTGVTVNICFCLDCTGSMSRWLAAAKDQMRAIIEGITTLIKKEYPSLNLKLYFAIVAYRDMNDQSKFNTQNFTDNIQEVITFLNRLTAQGGDDIPEDVLGALDQCLTLNWSATNARFIVLVTDAPGHGPELNSNLAIDKYPKVNISVHLFLRTRNASSLCRATASTRCKQSVIVFWWKEAQSISCSVGSSQTRPPRWNKHSRSVTMLERKKPARPSLPFSCLMRNNRRLCRFISSSCWMNRAQCIVNGVLCREPTRNFSHDATMIRVVMITLPSSCLMVELARCVNSNLLRILLKIYPNSSAEVLYTVQA